MQEFLDAQAALARWYALARTQPAALDLREEVGFFGGLAAEVRKIAVPDAQASREAEQAVRQFMSEGLAAGQIVDVLAIADRDRPELSVLSDEFLESISARVEHPNLQVRLLPKLLNDEIRGRLHSNRTQAKVFGEEIEALLRRYDARERGGGGAPGGDRQAPARRAPSPRAARPERGGGRLLRRAGRGHRARHGRPSPGALAHELVESIRRDLAVDWTDREDTEARVRTRIKRLLRRHRAALPAAAPGGASPLPVLNHSISPPPGGAQPRALRS